MKKNLTTMFGALMALALVASACGGSDDASAADQAVIDAIVAQSVENGDDVEGLDVDCMAAAMVSGLGGAEVMEEQWGLSAEAIANGQEPDDVELSVDDARSLADSTMDCGLLDGMATAMAEDMSDDDAACLAKNLDSDAIRDFFAAEFMSDADADRIGEAAEGAMTTSLFGAIAECEIDPNSIGF